MYANLSREQKAEIVKAFEAAINMVQNDVTHATAIAAHAGLRLSNKAWNGKTGSNAWAATLAVLVMEKKIKLEVAK